MLGKLILKVSLLVLREILALFSTTFTVDGKYPVQDCENLQLPIKMQLSEKPNAFSQLFVPFLESTSNFTHSEKRIIVIANVFKKLETVKILVRPLSKKRCFRKRFDSQHVKASKYLPNLHQSAFVMFFHHAQGSWFVKCLLA